MLAEGSKMVMVGWQSAYSQGIYGLVVNLGGLVTTFTSPACCACLPC